MARPNSDRPAVNHQMITLARESRGLSQQQLAAALGVTQGRVSKWEAGVLPVPEDLLNALADTLHYPRRFFFQSGPVLGPGVPEFFHRKRQDVPKKVLETVYARMNIRRLQVAALMRAVDIPCNVPRMDPDDYDGKIEEIARLVRANWYLPHGPVQNLTHTLEDAGVICIPFDFGTRRIDAISQWAPNLPPLIFVNEAIPKDRCRYSLAHELGHLILHASPNPDVEGQADRFAAEFLMPERDIRADLSLLTLEKLARLKRYWKVAMAALLKRAADLGEITTNQARYLWSQMAKAGYRTREPVDLIGDGEEPRLIQELIDVHAKDLGYGVTELGELVALRHDEFGSIYLPGQQHHVRLLPTASPSPDDARKA